MNPAASQGPGRVRGGLLMLRKSPCLVIAILALAPMSASAQVTLAWKFQEGETLLIENVEKTRQTLKLKQTAKRKEETHKTESTVTTRSRVTVKQKTAKETLLLI